MLGWSLAALGMLSVSTDALWVRLSETDGITAAFLVALFALPVNTTLSRWFDHVSPLESLRKHTKPLILVGSLGTISQISFIGAITQSHVANVVAIVSATPLIAAAVARLALREPISRRVVTAIFITITGVGLIVSSSIGSPNLRGDLLALLAITCFAIGMNIWRHHPEMSRFAGLTISVTLVVIVTAPFASPFSLDAKGFIAIAVMGFFFNPLGRLAHSSAPRFAPVSEVALFTPIETLGGVLWAVLFLNETPTATVIAGGLVVIAGLVYGTLATLRGSPTDSTAAPPL